jgi:hypothetical protein
LWSGALVPSVDSSPATDRDAPGWLLPALATASLRDDVPERRMLCAWLDSWTGAREVIDAMTDRGYNVRLSQSPFGWWAEFCRPQVSPSRSGSGGATTPPRPVGRFGLRRSIRCEELRPSDRWPSASLHAPATSPSCCCRRRRQQVARGGRAQGGRAAADHAIREGQLHAHPSAPS